MENYPFPFDRSYQLKSKNIVHIKLYYGSVHFGSPHDILEEVGQQVIMTEGSFKFKGILTRELVNQFTRELFPELEKVVLWFWAKYPAAHVELYGTSPRLIISDDGVGYWNRRNSLN